MLARVSRGTRRLALLVPVALTALMLLLLPRPLPLAPAARRPVLPEGPEDGSLGRKSNDNSLQIEEEGESETRNQANEIAKRPWFMTGGEQRPTNTDPHSILFPEDAPGYDRIVDQLMYTLPKEEDVPVKKILLANGMGAWPGATSGRSEFIRNKCPVDRCSITADSREAGTADAILFKDHFTPFNVRRPSKQIWILYYLECPYHTPSLRSASMNDFNWTATYRRDSDIVAPYERWMYHDPLITEKEHYRNYAANKTKKVAWFVSNCHARNHRLQYARQLGKHISVDIYGACGTHHCARTDPECFEMLDRQYKFYLSFENSNCQDYITEKLFVNGLQHDILPIVMGARPADYAAVAPYNSYIHVEEFMNPGELAVYLRRLDEDDTLYNSYFKWKDTGEFVNTYFFCRVCAMLHANDRRHRVKYYENVQNWWRKDTCTRMDWRSASEARAQHQNNNK